MYVSFTHMCLQVIFSSSNQPEIKKRFYPNLFGYLQWKHHQKCHSKACPFFLPGLLKALSCHSCFRSWKVNILTSWQRTSKTEIAVLHVSSEISVVWTIYRSSSSKTISFPGTFNTVELKHHFKISGMDSSVASERGFHSVGVVSKVPKHEYSNLSHRRLPPGHSIP